MKFAIAVELNDHRTVLRRNKMRYAGRNENETARGVPFQLCGFEFRSLAHIPGPSMMVASSSCGCVCARTHLRRESGHYRPTLHRSRSEILRLKPEGKKDAR